MRRRVVEQRPGFQAGLRIGAVARRTSMTVAALRAWETRYGLLRPVRSSGNQRLYTDADVNRVRAVQSLIAEGWSVAGAARHVLRAAGDVEEDHEAPRAAPRAEVRARRSVTAPPAASTLPVLHLLDALAAVDVYAVVATYEAARTMLRAQDAAGVRDTLVHLVERLGGEVGEAATQDDHVLPVDLSFGEGPPVLPRAAPTTLARMRLEAVLPLVVEDARVLVHRLQLGELGARGRVARR
jgi:DNA-binding transcriptional MerR regulator